MLTGLTDVSVDVARVKAAMIRSARQVILLADSSKWGQSMFAKIAALAELDVLVTDSGLPESAREATRRFGIELMEVSVPQSQQICSGQAPPEK